MNGMTWNITLTKYALNYYAVQWAQQKNNIRGLGDSHLA